MTDQGQPPMSDNEPPVTDRPSAEQDPRPIVGPRGSSWASGRQLVAAVVVVAVLFVAGVVWFNHHSATYSGERGVALQPAKLQAAQVDMTATGFEPSTVTVSRGQAVVWVNQDSKSHVVASDPYPTDDTLAGLNSHQPVPAKGSYSYIFSTPGTYTYHDNLRPSLSGTVIVK